MSKTENKKQQILLDAAFSPEVKFHRPDVQQLLVSKEEVPPEQQEWSSSLKQELSHIKEKQEELWTREEGGDITKLTFIHVPEKSEEEDEDVNPQSLFMPVLMKSEDDEEKPQSSQLHQSQTEQIKIEAERQDRGRSEPARNLNPDRNLKPATHDKTSHGSEPETNESCDWEETQTQTTGSSFLTEFLLHRTDVQQLLVCKEEVPPEQQEWSPHLNQEDQSKLLNIKEEQEELRTSQEGEQLQTLEEADINKFKFIPVPIKSEKDDDEEKSQVSFRPVRVKSEDSSQLHQRQTEENRDAEHLKTKSDGEDCGGSEPARNFNSDSHLQSAAHDETSDSSEPETDDSCDWEENRETQSELCNTGRKFAQQGSLKRHSTVHTGEKPFGCSVCGKRFGGRGDLRRHMTVHTGDKPFSCSVCGKLFTQLGARNRHSTIHTGEKPFSCSVCGEKFAHKERLRQHLTVHAEVKPLSCSVCNKTFTYRGNLNRHLIGHTGETI